MRALAHILLLLLTSLAGARAQPSFPTKPIRSQEGRYAGFAVDATGQLYVLTPGGQLGKYGPAGDSIGVFNEVRQYGRLSLIDVTNPMKPLLFYGDFGTLVILDRFMRKVNVVDLRRLGIFQARAVARSYDNQVWVYDGQDTRLRKVSEDGRILLSTPELRTVMDDPPMPHRIFDRNGMTYLYDTLRGLYVFDYYGAYRNRLEFSGWSDLEVLDGRVMGVRNGKVMEYSLKTPGFRETPLPDSLQRSGPWIFTPRGAYVREPNAIRLYPHWSP